MTIRKTGVSLSILAALTFGAAQFVRPTMKDPPHEALLVGADVPAEVSEIFERACQDCHSNNTHWPWYAKVTPVSFIVAKDVNGGRRFLNLSEWQKYTRGQQLGYLASMAEATRFQKMPPRVYRTMHADARLDDRERRLIAAWANEERKRVVAR
jgi:hypothetical protein